MHEDGKKSDIYTTCESLRHLIESLILPSKEKYMALTKLEEAKLLISKTDLIETE